jgi:hypothetical protein
VVNFAAGANTPLAGVASAALMALVIATMTGAFYYLPHAVLAATIIVSLPLDECSVKISANEVEDDDQDLNQGTWAGIVPFVTTIGEPIPADEEAAGLEVPKSVRRLSKRS